MQSTPSKPRLAAPVYQRLRHLDLCVVAPTKRGSKGFGRLKIPVRISRPSAAPSRPVGSYPGANVNNLRPIMTASVNKRGLSKSASCQGRTSLSLLNARSVCNKEAVIRDCIVQGNLDMLALTETWLTSVTEDRTTAGLLPEGYAIITANRKHGRGGGIALVHRTTLKCTLCKPQPRPKSFECLEVAVTSATTCVKLSIVYRPPPSTRNGLTPADFRSEFADYMATIQCSSSKVLVVGDFNVHIDNISKPDSAAFSELIESTSCRQHVNSATHTDGHILDLVISRPSDNIVHSVEVGPLISDHAIIHCSLDLGKPPLPKKCLTLRKLRAIDQVAVEDDLKQSPLLATSDTPPEHLHNLYNTTLRNILDQHAPEKSVTITFRPNTPWMNEDIVHHKRLRRRFESMWRRTGLQVHREMYVHQKDTVNSMIQKAKVCYYQDKIAQCDQDQKALFKIIQGLTKRSADQNSSSSSSHSPTEFNEFFLNKVTKIHNILDERTIPPPHRPYTEPKCRVIFDSFTPVSSKDIETVVRKSPSKSSPLDPWPTWMLKHQLTTLTPVIMDIINHSLSTGVFPSEWKHALVTPLLKKTTLDPTSLSNYRPVSNLPFLSKVTERVVAKQLTSYLQDNTLYPKFQSAYRAHHSVETALLRVHNDILGAIDNQQGVILVLLDLSAAFDSICHDVLLSRLQHRFGISGTVLKWLGSYLAGRTQSVVANGEVSSPIAVPHGVPQGSVLGPVLFSMYTAPLCDIVSLHGLKVHLYADDTQVYIFFSFRNTPSINDAMSSAQLCIADVDAWMVTNKLKLNGDKTELMVLTAPTLRAKVTIPPLTIGEASISASPSIRNLGSMWDQAATMEEHIRFVCKSCYYHLHNIAGIRHMLTRDATEKLMHAFVSSRLDSCNSLLLNVPAAQISKLQRVQNCAARIVLRRKKCDSISDILKELHWLPVKQRILFKVNCISYQCVSGTAPVYLSELVSPYVPQRSLRSTNQLLLQQPSSRTKSYGDRAFSVAAPKLWNQLPTDIRSCDSYTVFKKLLKTHLFKDAYY